MFAKKWVLGGLLVVVFAPACGAAGARGEVSNFLAQDGRLQEQLELRDAQEGFVGVRGELWSIEPSGRWRVARFLNEQIDEPDRMGNLTREELATLAEVLASQNFSKLPTQFGRDLKINRHLVTIRFGKRKTTLVLNAGETVTGAAPAMDDPRAAMWVRFIAIVETIQNLISDKTR